MKDSPESMATGKFLRHSIVVASVALAFCAAVADDAANEAPKNLTKVENRFFTMEVSPLGGRVMRLRSKFLDADLTDEGGSFTEFDWSNRRNRLFYRDKPFAVEPFRNGGECGVEVRGSARGGGKDFLQIEKKYTISDDSTALKVDYRFSNMPAAMSALIYALHIHTTLGIFGSMCAYYLPSVNGIVEVKRGLRPGSTWVHYPSRGWIAALDEQGHGVAITMPFREVKRLFAWISPTPVPTLEWQMIPVSIENGKHYDVPTEVIVFKGLEKVSGAGGGLVGEISGGKAKVFNSRKGSVVAKFGGKAVKLDFAGIGEVKTFPCDATAVSLEVDGKEVCRLDAPPAKGPWTLAPIEPRRESPMKSYDLTCFTNTPHQVCMPFAKPLAAKRPRVIAIVDRGGLIELGFLKDRFDCELMTTVALLAGYEGNKRPAKRTLGNPQYLIGDYFGKLSPNDMEDNMVNTLKKDADAILVGGLPWEALPKSVQTLIVEKVKAGCGLVWIGQSHNAPEICRTGLGKRMSRKVAPKAVTADFADVPFALLGAEPAYVFNAKDAIVHAVAGKAPWLTENALGKGRIIHLPYAAVFGRFHGVAGITPDLKEFYPDHVAPVDAYYSLIAKCLVRAAGIELPAAFGKVEVSGKGAAMAVTVGGLAGRETLTGRMQWRVRNRFGEVLANGETAAALKAGANELLVPFENLAPYAGQLAFEAVLRDGGGKVAAWGAWTFANEPSSRLESLAADRTDGYREGDTAVFSAKVAGGKPGLSVAFEFRDSYGRLLEEKTAPASAPEASFKIANDLVARMYETTARLMDGGREIDRLRVEVRACPSPEKRKLDDFTFGTWIGEWVRGYLWPEFAGLFREMHVSVNVAVTKVMSVDFAARHGMAPTGKFSCGFRKTPVPKEYVETGDKMKLVRPTCLSDPAFLKPTYSHANSYAEMIKNAGARFVFLGDEVSLTGYSGQPTDFCFSPSCLAAFREFLKGKYGSLEGVNAAWETDFKDWDSVLPFTKEEVWAEGGERHVAGWADHLEFMDDRVTNQISQVAKILRAKDPGIGMSVSGTQRPAAYGGLDWWKQMQEYNIVMSYGGGGQFDIQRSFRPDGAVTPWSWGYSARGEGAVANVWTALFIGCKGLMGYDDKTMINPDWTWSGAYLDVKPSMDRIAFGLGKHLINNLMIRPAVAILYSQPSIRGAFFEKRDKDHTALREKYIKLLRDIGVAFEFVSYDQLADGTFEKRGYKALLLADACAMSDAEVAAVKRYSAKGGLVLAEGVPALREQNCRPRKGSPLAGCVTMLSETLDVGYMKASTDPEVDAATAAIAPEQDRLERALAPILPGLPRIAIRNASDGSRFRIASVWPREGRHGELFWGIVSGEWQNSRLVDVAFPKKGHLFDLVEGKSLGYGDKFRVPLARARPSAFELLDEVPSIKSATADGATIRIAYSPSVDTVLNAAVFDPAGREVEHYSRKLVTRDGRAGMTIPFALSDARGTWKVVVKDVITGGSAAIDVQR